MNFVDATSLWSSIITYVLFVSWTGAILIGEKLNDDDDDDDNDVDIDDDVDKGRMHSLTSVYPKFVLIFSVVISAFVGIVIKIIIIISNLNI